MLDTMLISLAYVVTYVCFMDLILHAYIDISGACCYIFALRILFCSIDLIYVCFDPNISSINLS